MKKAIIIFLLGISTSAFAQYNGAMKIPKGLEGDYRMCNQMVSHDLYSGLNIKSRKDLSDRAVLNCISFDDRMFNDILSINKKSYTEEKKTNSQTFQILSKRVKHYNQCASQFDKQLDNKVKSFKDLPQELREDCRDYSLDYDMFASIKFSVK